MFTRDTGYSNYTVEGADVYCVHDRNRFFPVELPDSLGYGAQPSWTGLDGNPRTDRWYATRTSRCELYRERNLEFERVALDVDGDNFPPEESAVQEFLIGNVMPLLVRRYFKEK